MSSNEHSDDKITVYRGWPDQDLYVWSPFVTKVELRLRIADTPYKAEGGSTQSAPRKKIPYMKVHSQAPDMGDSSIIIRTFISHGLVPDINSDLDPTTKAHDVALRALLEDKLAFYHIHEMWVGNYYTMRDYILSNLPLPVRVPLGLVIYNSTVKTLYGQGTGRLTDEEIRDFRQEIWNSVNELLLVSHRHKQDSKEPFWVLGGDNPTEADMTLFGFIITVLICTAIPESQKVVRGLPCVVEYADRIHRKCFPDYQKWEEGVN